MNILEDIGGKLEENDLIVREGDKEIVGTTLADRVADSFAPSDRDADLFAPSEKKGLKFARTTNSIPSSNKQRSFRLRLKILFSLYVMTG